MLVEDFEVFIKQSEDLFVARPLDTRYSIKYRHVDGKLVLKVTDDRTCLKFVTDQQTDLKKLERLSALFFGLMSHDEEAAAAAAAAALVAPPVAELPLAAPPATAQQNSKKSRKKG